MSAFSCYNILKSQAKELSRQRDIQHAAALELVAISAKFSSFHELTKVAQANPLEVRLMSAALGVSDLREAIHEGGVPMALEQELEEQLAEATSETNASEFSIYSLVANSAEYDDTKGKLTLGVSLTYQGKQNQNRMYSGSAFFLDCTAQLLHRDGAWILAEEDGLRINSGESDRDRDREDELADMDLERRRELEPPKVSLAQALADELEIGIVEAEQLTEAEITVNDSDDGLVYGYWIDVEPFASTALKRKLMDRFGSLQIELSASFFEQVDNRLD